MQGVRAATGPPLQDEAHGLVQRRGPMPTPFPPKSPRGAASILPIGMLPDPPLFMAIDLGKARKPGEPLTGC